SDWYDGGVWLEMHHQTWTPVSSVGNGPGNGVWVVAFTGIARSNALLEALPNLTFTRRDSSAAGLLLLHPDGHVRRRADRHDDGDHRAGESAPRLGVPVRRGGAPGRP